MPDYDLGRAHGEVVITADTSGATRGMGEYEKATRGATEAAKEQSRVEQELTNRRRLATEAAQKRKDAEAEYRRVMKDSNSTARDQIEAEERRNKARGEHLQALRRSADAERALRAEVVGNVDAVKKFIRTIDDGSSSAKRHNSELRNMDEAAKKLGRTVGGLVDDMARFSNTLDAVLVKFTAIMGGGAAAGGLAGLLGAGGTSGLVSVIGGAVAVVSQLSGALLLLPAGANGAVAVLGTLKIATEGVSEAFKNMDDPAKFTETLQNMAPAAREVMTEIASFSDAFRGAKQVIQHGLFQPLIGEITPLVQTLLPVFMNGMQQIASIIGQAGAEFAKWFRSAENVNAINIVFGNIAKALQVAMQAMKPFSEALRTLSVVGSSFLPQIAQMITNIANSFNAWVQGAAASGKLQQFMANSLKGFSDLWAIIKNVTLAFMNMFNIGNGGRDVLGTIRNITQEFRNWTESVGGKDSISSFFGTIGQAANNLLPILKEVGKGVGTIISNFVQLGNATSGGWLSFFHSLGDALKTLGPVLQSMAPQLNEMLKVVGDAILQIVQQLGPQLPKLMTTFVQILKQAAPILVTLAGALAKVLEKLSPNQIEMIVGFGVAMMGIVNVVGPLVTAFETLSVAAGLLGISMGATVLVFAGIVVAIGLVVAAAIYLYNHWDQVKEKAEQLWDKLKEFGNWIGGVFSSIWHSIADAVSGAWDSVVEAISSAIDSIKEWFVSLPEQAATWGTNLIKNFVQGILDQHPLLKSVVEGIARMIPDYLLTHSPAKKGPLSEASPNEMGSRLVDNFASGMSDSNSSVANAASGVASTASGGFTSAGVQGKSGKAGQSGLEQWVSGLTKELSAWSQLFQHAFSLAKNVADVFVQGAKVVASLWNGGDNPMTRAGGLFGKPKGVEQQDVPGVPSADAEPGKAPLPELTKEHYLPKGGANAVPQQSVDGVPSVSPNGATTPANQAPANVQGQDPATTPGNRAPAPGDSALVAGLKAKGYSDKQIRLIQGFSDVEGKNPAGNPTLGWTDAQLGGDTSLQGHIDALDKQFKDRASVAGAFPENGTDQEQAQWIAKVVGQNGSSSDWQGNAQPKDYVDRVLKATQKYGLPAPKPGEVMPGTAGYINPDFKIDTSMVVGQPQSPGNTQGQNPPSVQGDAGYANGIPYGLARGTNTGGYGTGSDKVFPQWVMDLGARFGVKPSTYADHQESNRNEAGYAPNPGHLNRGIDWTGTPEQMQAFAEFANSRAGQDLGLEQIIWQNPKTMQKIGFGGGQNQSKTGYYPDTGEGSYQEHQNHVHTRQSSSWGSLNNQAIALRSKEEPLSNDSQALATQSSNGGDWMQLPKGWDPNTPIPDSVRQAHGIPDNLPSMYYSAPPGTSQNKWSADNDQNIRRGTTSEFLPGVIGDDGKYTGAQPGLQQQGGQQQSQQSPMETFTSGVAAAGNIAGDAFKVFDDVIQNIDATAKITATLVRGFENTEDVMKTIDEVQTYITTAADVAKLTQTIFGTAASFAGAGASADPSGGTAGAAAALGSVSAIAGLVNTALTTVNAGIDLGQEVYHMATKYGAMFSGIMLGNNETGPLGGNVRMLLNTNTGELMSYSEDNPDLKSTKQLPTWMQRSYGGNGSKTTQVNNQTQLNLYTGPGSNPNNLISDTMWLVNSGAPSAVSVSGQN